MCAHVALAASLSLDLCESNCPLNGRPSDALVRRLGDLKSSDLPPARAIVVSYVATKYGQIRFPQSYRPRPLLGPAILYFRPALGYCLVYPLNIFMGHIQRRRACQVPTTTIGHPHISPQSQAQISSLKTHSRRPYVHVNRWASVVSVSVCVFILVYSFVEIIRTLLVLETTRVHRTLVNAPVTLARGQRAGELSRR